MNSTTDTRIDPDTTSLDADNGQPVAEPETGVATREVESHYPPALSGAWFARLPRYRFASSLLRGRRVLEVQCGEGHGSAVLVDAEVESLVALDERPEMVQTARARLGAGSGAEVQLGRGSDLEFDENAFDAVVWLSPEWSADPLALSEVRRVLAPGGLFLGLWTNPEAYGLERVLPGAESRLLRDTSLVDACASLSEHFSAVSATRQIPVLQFRFDNVEELPVPGVPEVPVECRHLASAEPTADFAEAVFVCADEADDIDASGVTAIVAMPYFGLAESLGRVLGQLYRNVEDLSQRNLVLEGQVEDQMALAVDLEEEVREQRALAADQAERMALGASLDAGAGGTDLAMRYARSQAELAQTQQGLIDITADFSRRVQDLTWSLQERDGYIDHLVGTVRSWEEYANRTADELEARELALANLGEVYRKANDELVALRSGDGDTFDVRGQAGVVRAAVAQGKDPELVAATITEMRRSYDVLVAECGDLHHQLAQALLGRAEAERARAQSTLDQKEQRAAQETLASRLDAQRAELDEFAAGVRAVFEERNQLLREKKHLKSELADAHSKVEKKHEANLDIEREMTRRSLRIAALERDTMSKNIENTTLEKENLRLLAFKSDGDDEIARLTSELAAVRDELAEAKAVISPPIEEPAPEVAEPAGTVEDEVEAEDTADDAPAGAEPHTPLDVEAAAENETAPEVIQASEEAHELVPTVAKPQASDLTKMTVAGLRAAAKAAGLKGYSRMRKDALIAALTA
jgi:SAM-dependent methyltransferase